MANSHLPEYRRRASQLLFRAVVDDEFPEDVQTPVAKLRYACKTVIAEKSDEQYELGNLLKDPDDLWLFRDGNGLEPLDDLPTDDPEFPTNCSVCIEPYAPVDQWPTHGPSTPVKTPCGHYFCSKCLKAWLEECIDEYTCPVCRACLVCGDNGCRFHVIRRDNAPPTPLPHVLNVVLGPSKGLQPLHGIQVSVYWNLRERTRHLRADLAGIESELSRANVDFEDPVYKQLVVYFRDIWSTLRRDVKKELKHQSR
ncbi:hypothetical protein BDV95DRAFT_663869 [Massariosphaeria phaeospora]|uniref:RING-type domain-containing protein n=1 Tax=Massariosphaeria phaeospora TaxID=100035 RepID=A0A7C8IE36_9PLEO|nr:hypothetical protein BDV95DRAFT_663869 [Massariosphaeria phaeospora]